MYVLVAGLHSRARIVLTLSALMCGACGGGEAPAPLDLSESPDDEMVGTGTRMNRPTRRCDMVQVEGDVVIEQEQDFTARYRMGAPYTKTVMLFGGESVEDENVLSNAYIFALDQADAQMLAQRYPDFYLCSSEGGQEASSYIIPLDLVPASCEVHEQILAALRQYHRNASSGGDRTSLRFEGAPLELESVIEDATGVDATEQASGDFHLVTSVEQLTGQTLLEFGTTE
jgi:hypothetical protein